MQIELKNIKKSYGKNEVLKDVTLAAKDGECIGILGGNGSGKTTTLNVMAALLKAYSGTVRIFGKKINKKV